eukprot:CAMPEP_0114276620 /NCGR_PEP_ID=MMETSP0059-20121206/330_1 /TAXON_ID=36894 /ORGANISM="Pyramimonas parkeae, Strain CCMP726" /LENGTH=147 /DNA_ID=CAMNT_0001396623 /DNA_START=60 /DNA_END=499 /DNA_ORIENTATION=+
MAATALAYRVAVRTAVSNHHTKPVRRISPAYGSQIVRVVPTCIAKLPTHKAFDAEKLAAIGAFTALTAANPCLAVQEVAEVAGDGRLGIFALLFGPVLGWVAFNILGPGLNQLDNMSDKNKGIVGAMGISTAALMAAPSAEAAQEIA